MNRLSKPYSCYWCENCNKWFNKPEYLLYKCPICGQQLKQNKRCVRDETEAS